MQYRIREESELKPSGIEWLGDIPKDWQKGKIKYLFKLIKEKSYESNPVVFSLTQKGIKVRDVTNNEGQLAKTYEGYIQLRKNDFVLNPMDLISGYVDKAEFEGVISPAYISFNKKERSNINLEYYKYYFQMHYYNKYLFPFGEGVSIQHRWTLKNEVFLNFTIIQTIEKEQQKIANFLDEKSEIFDEAISKKEQLISKLELAKQSLISEVVTGKLKVVETDSKLQTLKREPNELKPSGVEWLGDIPKEWQVKKSKYLFEIRKRIAGTLGFDVLSITQKGIKIKDITTGGGQLSMDYSKYQIVNVGDFAMNHMDLLTGFVDIAKTKGVTSPDYRVFTLTDKASDSNYFLYLFQMGYKNQIFFAFGQGSSQLGRWRFPTEEFNKFYFPYPSENEQKQISKYLDEKLIHFDKAIEKTKQSIAKLKLVKEALISQAVTGKIEIL